MALKKKNKLLLENLAAIGEQKGIGEEQIVEILKESFVLAFSKKFEDEMSIIKNYWSKANKDETKLSPALIQCTVDMKKGIINIARQWLVKEEDDIVDDFIEISIDNPLVQEKGLKVGDYYEEPLDIDILEKTYVDKFKSNFQQKISKAEKDALVETYKNKIGELVNGTIVKVDPHSVIVELSIGKYSATLYDKDLIGKEVFSPGENIKVFIKGIGKDSRDTKSGNLVQISRSCEGFLRKLFEQEVHEIYDGTVQIKGIVRKAGQRSKVAVYANNLDVDPCGACIGPNGGRIQAIVSQLGRTMDNSDREKIDVICYHENKGLYLCEALRPGIVIGAKFSEDGRKAVAVCEDGTASYAIGKHKTNLTLAMELLDLDEIRVIDESKAIEENLEYTTVEQFEIQEKEENRRKIREKALKLQEERAKKAEEEKVNAQDEKAEESYEEVTPTFEEPTVEVATIEKTSVEIKEESTEKQGESVVEENATVEEQPKTSKASHEENIETVEVSTTISLSDLEASLENEKKLKEATSSSKKKKHDEISKIEKEKHVHEKPLKKMEIYTEEELKEFEDEDLGDDLDLYDDDYFSEYDDDDYYEG